MLPLVSVLGKNIRRLRRAAELTQEQIGDLIEIDQSAISKWERGKAEPTVASLPALAFFLHSSLDELLKGIYAGYDDSRTTPRKPGGSSGTQQTAQERHLTRQLSEAKAVIRQLGKLGEETQPADVTQKRVVSR